MRCAHCSDATHALRSVRRPARPRAQEYDTSPHPVNPFSKRHYLFWGFINLLPLALAPAARTHFGLLGTMFLFASTIKGYLYGVALPRPLKMVVHPLIMCCLYTSGCVGLWAYLTNMPYLDILQMYMPTVRRPRFCQCVPWRSHDARRGFVHRVLRGNSSRARQGSMQGLVS